MILGTKVSFFEKTTDTEVKHDILIGTILQRIKNGAYKEQIEKLRAGDESVKRNLPTVSMHGLFEYERKKSTFYEASGLIILDIDDVKKDEIQETKEDIMSMYPNVLAAITSPSGTGIKVLYYVLPELVTADSYRQIGKQLVSDFEIYGKVDYLSITDTLIVSYDPDILINEEVYPAFIYVKEFEREVHDLEKRDTDRPLWDDAQEFFETVLLESIADKTNNNYHFIQVSVLDLKKFGFEHPKDDLSFVIEYAEEYFKKSNENKKRFDEVTEIAKLYPQKNWPYKTTKSDDDGFEEEAIDYSQFKTDDHEETEIKKDVKTDDESLIIDYETFLERVKTVVQEGDRVGFEISFKQFADILRFRGTGIMTITGIPGHGKTEFLDAITIDLARLYGHSTIVCGFEQSPEEHVVKLIRKLLGVDVTCKTWFNKSNYKRFEQAYNFITSKFRHIDTNRSSGNINTILEAAAKEIQDRRKLGNDVKYIILDPFNMLSIKGRYTQVDKIEEILRRITQFSHQMGVLVFLVAHPFKMKKDEKTGFYEVPDFYSVKGSSAFFEMSYHGLVVYRTGTKVMVRILKVKQANLGQTGMESFFDYEKHSGRYIPEDTNGNELAGDHYAKDWLEKALETVEKLKLNNN